MDGVSSVVRGAAVAGRYRLDRCTGERPSASWWAARDTVLDRPVELLAVRGEGVEDVLDAARRAAVVADPRLLRVLDVGTVEDPDAGEVAFVVTESVAGPTLTDLVAEHGPLPPALVRTVVGEAAQALERARGIGLHHRRLTTDLVLRAADGGIKVAGLEVQAAVADADAPPVPGTPSEHGPAGAGGASAARQDAVGLVALCYAGLTGRWPAVPGVADHLRADGLPRAPLASGAPVPPGDLVDDVPADLDTLCAVTFGPHGDGPHTPGELADQLAPWDSPYTDGRAGGGSSPARAPGRGAVGTTAAGVTAVAAGTAAARSSAAPPEVASSGIDDLWSVGDGFPAGLDADPDEHPDGAVGGDGADDVRGRHLGQADEEDPGYGPDEDLEPDDEPTTPPRRTQWAVIGTVAAVVVVGLVVAVQSLSGLGDDLREVTSGGPATTTSAPSASPGTPSASPSPTPSTPSAAPPQIASVTALDPEGDGEEHDDVADNAVDGDPDTVWDTSTYATADFGNLKSGLGYAIELAEPGTVSQVTLTTRGSGGAVELRTAPGPGLEGSTVVARSPLDGGTVRLTPSEPVQTQDLVLWFTELPEVSGEYRLELADVQVQ